MAARLEDLRLAADLRRSFRNAQVEMAHALAGCRLTEQGYHLLLAVGAAGHAGAGQSELAEELGCPAPRISLLVRDAAEAGLLETFRPGDDRRHVRARLTRDGSRRLARALAAQRRALRLVVRRLDRARVETMLETAASLYLGLKPPPASADLRTAR
jgi:DNA-binding MarR family transcriptional regulator